MIAVLTAIQQPINKKKQEKFDFVEELSKKANVTSLDALELSVKAGSIKAVNVVLIGVLAKTMNIEKQIWLDVIKETVPPKFLELN